MANNFQTEKIASITAMGHMQAVSEDGNVVVYRTEDSFYVYYFDGQSLVANKFQLALYLSEVNEKYREEANVWSDIYTRRWGSYILVYVLGYNKKQLAKAIISLDRDQDSDKKEIELDSNVFDMGLHPFQDCLIILNYNSLNFIFRGNGQPDYQFMLPSSNSALGGKLVISQENGELHLYTMVIREDSGVQSREYCHIKQKIFGSSYQMVLTTVDNLNEGSLYYDRFEVFTFDPENHLFGVVRDHINSQSTFREYMQFFVSTDFVFYTLDTDISDHVFHSFLPNNRILCGKFDNFVGAPKFHLTEMCLVKFSILENEFIVDSDDCSCKIGYFDRVAVWTAEEQTYILSQIDYTLTISQRDFNDEIPFNMTANTFSVKKDDFLIIDNFGELQYLSWMKKVQTPEVEEQDTAADGYIIAMVILIVCVVFLSIGLVWVCLKLRNLSKNGESSQQDKEKAYEEKKVENYDKNPFAKQSKRKLKTPPKRRKDDQMGTQQQLRIQ